MITWLQAVSQCSSLPGVLVTGILSCPQWRWSPPLVSPSPAQCRLSQTPEMATPRMGRWRAVEVAFGIPSAAVSP